MIAAAADPAARPAAVRASSCRPPSTWPPSAPDDGTVEYGIGPHAAYTVPLPVLREAPRRAARSTGCCCTCTSPRPRPRAPTCWPRTASRCPALLAAHDVLGGRVLAAHCVHMDDGDLELWQEYDVAVAHCPASNAKLASGVARLRDMLDRGIRVGMGTDGPASNDGLDLLADLRLAASLARLAGALGDRADGRGGVLAGHRRRGGRRSAGPTWGSSRPAAGPTWCTSTPGTWCSSRWATRATCWPTWSGPAPAGTSATSGWAAGRSSRDGASTTVDTEALRHDVAAARRPARRG